MNKGIQILLVILLAVSVGFNLVQWKERQAALPDPGEIKGAYELFLIGLKGMQMGLNDLQQTGTDPDKRRQAMYRIISSSHRMHDDLRDVNVKAEQLYGYTLPLHLYTQGYVMEAGLLFTSSASETEFSVQAQEMSREIDELVGILEGTSFTDEVSGRQTIKKLETGFLKKHDPFL